MTTSFLRALTVADEAAFKEAVREFAEREPAWGFAFDFDPNGNFADYVDRLQRHERGIDLPAGWVPSSYWVACVGDRIVGRVSLRHQLNPFLRDFGGHVGYGVVPSCRRRGYATQMLRDTLPLAHERGIEKLLITCDDDNLGSIRTIERCGGELEDKRTQPETGTVKRRYWIDLTRLDV